MVRFIQCDGEVSGNGIRFPSRDDLFFVAIDHRDLTGIGNVRENSPAIFLEDERLGMSRKLDRTDLLSVRGVDDRDATVAEANINFAVFGSDIIRVVAQAKLADRLEGFSIVNFAEAIFVVRDEKTIELRRVTYALWCAETGNGMNPLAFSQINYFNAVIA